MPIDPESPPSPPTPHVEIERRRVPAAPPAPQPDLSGLAASYEALAEPGYQRYAPPAFLRPLRVRQIPNVGHTLLLLVIAGGTLFITEIAAFSVAMGMHMFGRESTQQLLRDPRLLIPTMALSYGIALLMAQVIFTRLWKEPFAHGVRWEPSIVGRRFYAFLGLGILLSFAIQLLSNYLPIPKTLPIDDFFRTRADIWLVAVFGTFIAPVFEELAFRGFLFPSLASAWDWVAQRGDASRRESSVWTGDVDGHSPESGSWNGRAGEPEEKTADPASADPKWSLGALIFSSAITSIGFALLHADQLAHSWAPLMVLFAVSVILCLVRLRAHSLAASTLVHATYNGTIFVLIFIATDGFRHLDKINQ